MIQITSLNDSYKQQFQYDLATYDPIDITLEFKEAQQGWFFSLTYATFEIYQERISVALNLLRQFRNIIPFGILVSGPDSMDPVTNDAWLTGWEFYIIDQTDIADIEASFYVR